MPASLGLDGAGGSAGLRDQQRAGDPVPRIDLGLDPGVQTPGGDPGELERAGAGVTDEARLIEEAVGDPPYAREDEAVLAEERGDVGLVQGPGGADGVPGFAAPGGVELAAAGVEHGGDRGSVLVLQRDRAAPAAGQSVREAHRAVDGVDQPAASRA